MTPFAHTRFILEANPAAAGQPLQLPQEFTSSHKLQYRTDLCEGSEVGRTNREGASETQELPVLHLCASSALKQLPHFSQAPPSPYRRRSALPSVPASYPEGASPVVAYRYSATVKISRAALNAAIIVANHSTAGAMKIG